MSEESTKRERRSRIHPESVIHMGKDESGKKYGPDHNPRRPGTDCGTRFVSYKDGMTVSEARAAGLTAADVRSDSDEGYIVVTEPKHAKADSQAEAA